jgi:nitrate reductase gamma subunit
VVEATRTVFEHLSEELVAVFYLLSAIAIAIFALGLALRVRKYRRGSGRVPIAGLPGRLARAAWVVARHTTIGRDDPYVLVAHFLTFWGFAALFAATAILTLDYDIVRRFYPPGFWHGAFFLGYELGADLGGIALVTGVIMLMARRWVARPFRLSYARVDLPAERYDRRDYARGDTLFLVFLLALGLSGFLLEASRIVADRPDYPPFAFAGAALAAALQWAGLTSGAAETLRAGTWWIHAIAALSLVAYLPYGKGVHMFLDVASLVVRDENAGRRLPAAGVA